MERVMERKELKEVFMELGNKLVQEHGFEPTQINVQKKMFELCNGHYNTTLFISMFTVWLNKTEEAREVLSELGIDWRMK